MISTGARRWIENATVDQLQAKVAEYQPRDTDKPRDVEFRVELRIAMEKELAKRGFPIAG